MKPRILAQMAEKKTGLLHKVPLVELAGRNRVLIENHMGVLAYSLEEIYVKVTYGKIVITGKNLHLLQLNGEQLVISGSIDTIQPMGG